MQKYRHRYLNSVEIEGARLGPDNVDELANWTQAQIVEEKDALNGEPSEGLNVKTSIGKKRASRGMYVFNRNGEFFVLPPSEFEAAYEPIT